VRNVSAGGHASDTELETLKHLWLFQFVRSKRALTERLMIEAAMREKISIGQEDNPFLAEFFGQPLNEEGVLKSVLQSCDDFYATISDLKSVLLVNNCGEGFVLSDNPAVSSNKLVLMRFRNYGNWGLQSGGYYLFYPLTPKLALLAYDQSVYELRGRHVNCCEVNASDVRALNQLVYLHSDNLIILPNFGDQRKIIDNLKAVSEVKPDTLWRLNVAVKDDSRSTEERSVFLIATDEEFSKSGHGLVHVESVPPSVPRHLPRLKIKHAPKFVDTKSGSGLVRWSFRN